MRSVLLYWLLIVFLFVLLISDCTGKWCKRRRRRRRCSPTNCQVNSWGNWGLCLPQCNVGSQSRSRSISVGPDCGGQVCPPLLESHSCGAKNGGCEHFCANGVCSCNGGYQLQSDGQTCRLLDCGSPSVEYCPSDMTYGTTCRYPKFSCGSGTTYGKECSVLCPTGYRQASGSAKITCEMSGAWTSCDTMYCSRINQPPSKITLSATTAQENVKIGTAVGTLSTTDPNPDDLHTYQLLDSAGGKFQLDNAQLLVNFSPDDEAPPNSYVIKVLSTDDKGLYIDDEFTIKVDSWSSWSFCSALCDVGLQLRTRSISVAPECGGKACPQLEQSQKCGAKNGGCEHVCANGVCSCNRGYQLQSDRKTCRLVDCGFPSVEYCPSDTTCGTTCQYPSFSCDDGTTYEKTCSVFCPTGYGQASGSAAITCEESGAWTSYDTFYCSRINQPPIKITLWPTTVCENVKVGTVVGTLSTTDPNTNDTHTYRLLDSAGGKFQTDKAALLVAFCPDYETPPNSYFIKLRSSDDKGLYVDADFTIDIENVNEPLENIVSLMIYVLLPAMAFSSSLLLPIFYGLAAFLGFLALSVGIIYNYDEKCKFLEIGNLFDLYLPWWISLLVLCLFIYAVRSAIRN